MWLMVAFSFVVLTHPMFEADKPMEWMTQQRSMNEEFIATYSKAGFDSLNVRFVGSYDTPGCARGVYVSGDYAYVADGEAGLRVIDVSDPQNPVEVGYYDTPGYAVDVYISGGYAYVAAGYAGLRVIDVNDPSNPVEVGHYDTPGCTYDVYVSGGYAYVADEDSGLQVIDISDPQNPVEVGYYNTPGWALGVYVSGGYAYVADDWAGLRVIDISDPSNPEEVGYYDTPDYAWDVYVSGDYAYVAAWYAGLRVIDVSDPTSPEEVGYYDTPGSALDVYVSGDYAYVADYDARSLRVTDMSDPENPVEVGYYDTPDYAYGVYVSGGYTYVASCWAGLQIYQFYGAALNPFITEIACNRSPAVIPQDYASTCPIMFPDGDRGPLKLWVKVFNPSDETKCVQLVVTEYIDPYGMEHHTMGYFDASPKEYIEPNAYSYLDVDLIPPHGFLQLPDVGEWSAKVVLIIPHLFSEDERLDSCWIDFEVKPHDELTVEPPAFELEDMGVTVAPPSCFTDDETLLYHGLTLLQLIFPQMEFGQSYIDYYEELESVYSDLFHSACLVCHRPTINDYGYRELSVDWAAYTSFAPYQYDRAVLVARFPEGITPADIISADGAHVTEVDNRTVLTWYLNAVDKRIWSNFPHKYRDFLPTSVTVTVNDYVLANTSYNVEWLLFLELGPFKDVWHGWDSITSVSDAPWVYDYERWQSEPSTMYWYVVSDKGNIQRVPARTGGKSNNLDTIVVMKGLEHDIFMLDGTELAIPMNAFDTSVTLYVGILGDTMPHPDSLELLSSMYHVEFNGYDQLPNSITLNVPLEDIEEGNLGMFWFNINDSSWIYVPSELNVEASSVIANLPYSGVYAVFRAVEQLPSIPPVELIAPLDGAQIITSRPALCWSDTVTGWQYQLQVAMDSMFSDTLLNTIVYDTEYVIGSPLTLGTYYWRVRRTNCGVGLGWSDIWQFTIVEDSIPPDIEFISPQNYDTTGFMPEIIIMVTDSGTGIDLSTATLTLDTVNVYWWQLTYDNTANTLTYTPDESLHVGIHHIVMQVADYAGNVSVDSLVIYTMGVAETPTLPDKLMLYHSWPNPFTSRTCIKFAIPQVDGCDKPHVTLSIYDITGRLIRTLVDDELSAGYYSVEWHADNDVGQKVTQGIYLCELKLQARGLHTRCTSKLIHIR